MSKTISARIDDTLHSMITDEANQEGKTVNESLKEMLNNHFNEEGKSIQIIPSTIEEVDSLKFAYLSNKPISLSGVTRLKSQQFPVVVV